MLRRVAQQLAGAYLNAFIGSISSVSWDPATSRLTDAPNGTAGADGILAGVTSGNVTGISRSGKLSVYQVGSTGLVTPAVATYRALATPDGWTRTGALANGDCLFRRTVNGTTQVMAYNVATGAQGPVIDLLNSTIITNGDAFLVAAALGAAPAPTPYRFASSGTSGSGAGFNRLIVSFAEDDEAAPRVHAVGSGGIAALGFQAPPFWFARSGQGVVRQADVVLGDTALQRSGVVYVPGTARTWEFALDPITGQNAGRNVRGFRKAQRLHFGFLRIGGGVASFISCATQDAALSGQCEQWPGTGEYILAGQGQWTALNESTVGIGDWIPIGVLSTGCVLRSPSYALLRYVPNGGSPVDRPYVGSDPVVLPHLDALVAADPNNYGAGRISFDAGATWRDITLLSTPLAGIPPSTTNIPPSRTRVPLYPL